MRKELGGGDVAFDMSGWPEVVVAVQSTKTIEAGEAEMEALAKEITELLSEVILSAHRRGLRFRLRVVFGVSVSEVFSTCMPLILRFAMAMAREDLFEASAVCMEGTRIQFTDPEDRPLIEVVADLIAHVPQSAPIVFEMAGDEGVSEGASEGSTTASLPSPALPSM